MVLIEPPNLWKKVIFSEDFKLIKLFLFCYRFWIVFVSLYQWKFYQHARFDRFEGILLRSTEKCSSRLFSVLVILCHNLLGLKFKLTEKCIIFFH